jgi:hypothetical protein
MHVRAFISCSGLGEFISLSQLFPALDGFRILRSQSKVYNFAVSPSRPDRYTFLRLESMPLRTAHPPTSILLLDESHSNRFHKTNLLILMKSCFLLLFHHFSNLVRLSNRNPGDRVGGDASMAPKRKPFRRGNKSSHREQERNFSCLPHNFIYRKLY